MGVMIYPCRYRSLCWYKGPWIVKFYSRVDLIGLFIHLNAIPRGLTINTSGHTRHWYSLSYSDQVILLLSSIPTYLVQVQSKR